RDVMPRSMARLHHVYVQPRFRVDLLRGGMRPAGDVIGEQRFPSGRFQDSLCHRTPYRAGVYGIVDRRTVASQNPDNVFTVFVTVAKPMAVAVGILHRKNLRTDTPHAGYLVAPGR